MRYENIKLDKCPFCKGEAAMFISRELGVDYFQVNCKLCYARVGYPVDTPKDAAALWNFRK